jgi:hypothetical protein
MTQDPLPPPTYKVELTYTELSDLCGILALYWVEHDMNEDNARALMDKLAKVKKEINNSSLN